MFDLLGQIVPYACMVLVYATHASVIGWGASKTRGCGRGISFLTKNITVLGLGLGLTLTLTLT